LKEGMKQYLGYLGRNNKKLPLDSRKVYNSLMISSYFVSVELLLTASSLLLTVDHKYLKPRNYLGILKVSELALNAI
jgi:hypothetical protein